MYLHTICSIGLRDTSFEQSLCMSSLSVCPNVQSKPLRSPFTLRRSLFKFIFKMDLLLTTTTTHSSVDEESDRNDDSLSLLGPGRSPGTLDHSLHSLYSTLLFLSWMAMTMTAPLWLTPIPPWSRHRDRLEYVHATDSIILGFQRDPVLSPQRLNRPSRVTLPFVSTYFV